MNDDVIKCWKKETCNDLLDTLQIDDIDMKIIRILTENARISNVDIAHKIGISEGTVRRRISQMVEKGIIEGFILLLNCKEAEKCVKAFINLEVDNSCIEKVVEEMLRDHERIITLYRMNTKFNIMCEAMFLSVIELQGFIDRISRIEGINNSEVNMVIGSYKKCMWTGI